MKTGTKVLAALGLGLAAGAIAGILMAPRKGSETRNLIRKKGDQLADNVASSLEEGKKKINVMKDTFKDKMVELNKTVQELS